VTVEDTWRRIARALASVEADPAAWEGRFLRCAGGFPLPARGPHRGRGGHRARSVTLFNCFVMGTIPDSMGGIFEG
jgi:ribonucleoside-diphosphate reductase alpha chain